MNDEYGVTTQACRCERTSAKQSPIKQVNLGEKFYYVTGDCFVAESALLATT